MKKFLLLPLAILLAAVLWPQKQVNGSRGFLGIWDAANAISTRPDKVVTADPATCSTGETVWRSDTAKARRCIAPNTWADDGGSTYALPAATASTLGGVRVGSGLNIDGSGVLSSTSTGGICDPFDLTKFCLVEDFATGTNSSGGVGVTGMTWAAIASGTLNGYSAATVGTNNNPGLARIQSTSSANSGGTLTITFAGIGGVYTWQTLLDTTWETRWLTKVDSTTDVRVRLGLSYAATAAPATGDMTLGFRYDTDASFSDNTKGTTGRWVAQFCGYNSGACGDTGGVYFVTSVQPNTNFHVYSVSRSGSTFYWKIDGTTVATMCASGCDMATPSVTNPSGTAAPHPRLTFANSSTSTRNLYVDYFSHYISGLTRF